MPFNCLCPVRVNTSALVTYTLANIVDEIRLASYLLSASVNTRGQPFFYMAFACCVNVVYMVSVHTSST